MSKIKNFETKIKSYGGEAADFHDKEISKVDSNHIYLAVISLDFALSKDWNYSPQVLFEKNVNTLKKKLIRQSNYDFEEYSYSDESDEE